MEGKKAAGMPDGCCGHEVKFDGLSAAYKRALWAVIAINGTMFLAEMGAGIFAGSQALKADALDFLGDTATYALTLFVVGMPLIWRARAALFKGLTLGAMGLWVLGATAYHVLIVGVPEAAVMGAVGFLALAANLTSVLLLLKYRNGDANVRSVWLCSRNDAIGNVAVILAAGGVWSAGTAWPDLIVAGIMASLFLWSSSQIVRQARHELAQEMAHQKPAADMRRVADRQPQ
jgi:Co/Zn/Cd efflux system component